MLLNKDVIGLIEHIVGIENLKLSEPMKYHTSFKVGGPADVMVMPANREQLIKTLGICKREGVPVFVMGKGTNLIVRERGIRGVVIKTFERFNGYKVKGNLIEACSGILLSKVAGIALEHGLSGLEFASGIPGTLGGAVCMNAGAYGGEIKDVVIETEYIDKNNEIKVLNTAQHDFGYRSSRIQIERGIILKSKLKLKYGNAVEIKELMDDLNRRRREKQPLQLPSAGSVFRRPEGYYAGKLIQDCGLKGYRIGEAEVSPKHCGFIVNSGSATADDIINLINHVKQVVSEHFGVDMKTEVKIVGEE